MRLERSPVIAKVRLSRCGRMRPAWHPCGCCCYRTSRKERSSLPERPCFYSQAQPAHRWRLLQSSSDFWGGLSQHMPLERSKQTIDPNSEVPRIGVPRFLELLELLRRHVRRQGRMTHALATVEPTGSAPSLRPRNGMRHGAGCHAQRPRNGGLCGPHPPRPAQPLLRRAALHHGGEQLARAQRAYEPSSLGAARAPPLGSAQRRRVPAPASHPHQRCQRCRGLGSSAVLTVGCARLSNDRQARRSRS